MLTPSQSGESLRRLIADRSATVGVIGLGYVGLPLAAAIARVGFRTVGFDVDAAKIEDINAATSYIDAVSDDTLAELVQRGALRATQEFGQLTSCDVIIICVPTPLTRHREPDLSYVQGTARTVAQCLRSGQLVVLEFDDLSRHDHRRGEADPGGDGAQERSRFFPRVLARARRSGEYQLRNGDDSKDHCRRWAGGDGARGKLLWRGREADRVGILD